MNEPHPCDSDPGGAEWWQQQSRLDEERQDEETANGTILVESEQDADVLVVDGVCE